MFTFIEYIFIYIYYIYIIYIYIYSYRLKLIILIEYVYIGIYSNGCPNAEHISKKLSFSEFNLFLKLIQSDLMFKLRKFNFLHVLVTEVDSSRSGFLILLILIKKKKYYLK